MDNIMGVVDNFMRQDKATRRQVLELLKKHLGHFQADLDRLLRAERGDGYRRGGDGLEVDLAEENIREQFMLHELFKPPLVDRDPEEDEDLL
jgi:hypothetical protein